MLNEYRQLYEKCADNGLSDWRLLDKNVLCNKYIEHKGTPLENSYLSAIIVKYWGLIESWYSSQQYKFATEEDCYELVIDSILYALNKHTWLNPESSLYGDENGPDKAINVCVKSRKVTFYQLSSKDIRKLNYNSLSLEAISENVNDDFYIEDENNDDKNYSFEAYIEGYIKNKFKNKDYFLSFFIDMIVNIDVFSSDLSEEELTVSFSPRKVTSYFKKMPIEYVESFSLRYGIDKHEVEEQLEIIKGLTYKQISDNIKNGLLKLTYDRDFMRWLKGC